MNLDATSLLSLVGLLFVAWIAGTAVAKLGYPALLGELAAGIVFGPPILGIFQPSPILTLLGTLGTLVMMLLVGMRIDARDLAKSSGWALVVALGGFFLTMFVGFWVATALLGRSFNEGLIVGVALSNTALATIPRIVLDLDMTRTKVGQMLVAVSLLTVAILLTTAAGVESIVRAGAFDVEKVGNVVVKAAIFLIGATVIGIFGFPLIKPILSAARLSGRGAAFSVCLIIGALFAGLAWLADLNVILGAFIAGIFLRGDMFPEGDFVAASNSVEDVAYRFLAPIFFVSAGFPVTFTVFQTLLVPLLLVLVGALLAKFVAAFLLSRPSGLRWRESVVLGLGMNSRGGVDIVVARNNLQSATNQNGVLGADLYTIILVVATIGTLATPILLKAGRDWLKGRGELGAEADASATPVAQRAAAGAV